MSLDASPDAWQADLTSHGDIHPHPGPCSFTIWNCNVGRGTGVWEFFNLAKDHKIDFITIQEDVLFPAERSAFYKYVAGHRYRIYGADSIHFPQGAFGGALLLVKTSLRSCHLASVSLDDGQCVTAIIENIAITSVYQPPTQPRLTLAEHFQEILIWLPRHTPCCCVGDHNDVPAEHVMIKDHPFPGLAPYFVAGPAGDALSTRGEGNRCIDYFITNRLDHISNMCLLDDEDIADHKTISAIIHANSEHSDRDRPHRLVKLPNLQQPEQMPMAEWHSACNDYVAANPPITIPGQASQASIDDLWNSLSSHYENMLTFAISQHE